ncbi:MAG: tetratricopeptide repeat protein, partial [Fimbriiglobus sp.]
MPVAAAVVFLALAAGQPADGTLVRGESAQTRKRLAEAQQKLADGKSADATADLLAILIDAGDDLVSTDGRSYQPARRVAHSLLAQLPADALRAYRTRADAPARALLARGKETRDPRPLRELLDRYSVSRPAEDALMLLGELAFERGEFRTAAAYWQQLVPGSGDGPRFPDPTTDPATVRARLVLADLFAGNTEAAKTGLITLKSAHPTAVGRLAGKSGRFTDTLESLLAGPPPLLPPATANGDRPTFAGGFSRNGAVTGTLPHSWPGVPTWKSAIPAATDVFSNRTRPVAGSGRECAFHPVALDGRFYLADAARVIGFDPRTGRAVVAFDWEKMVPNVSFDLALPQPPNADFTLTAMDGRLYARFGSPTVSSTASDGGLSSRTMLVALAPDGDALKLVWSLPPPVEAAGVTAVWEGAPVVADGRVIAAFARFEGNRTVHAVAAFDDPPG